MKIELRLLIFSLISNLLTTIVKIVGGLVFQMSSLVADGFHTFSDFVSDIMAIIGYKLSKKKPTKENPFGFGRVQYLTNLFIGILLFLLGIFLAVISFFLEIRIPNMYVLLVLMISIFIKIISILYMEHYSKSIKTKALVVSIQESKSDLISSFCIILIAISLYFSKDYPLLKYADLIGSVILSILVAKAGFEIIKNNALDLLGTIDTDQEKIKIIEEIINRVVNVKIKNIELIKYGDYYKVHLVVVLDPNMKLKEIEKIECKIIKALKCSKKISVKHINIDVDPL